MSESLMKDRDQRVGQFDARQAHQSSEKNNIEFTVEQQHVSDALQVQGKNLERKIIDARKSAGEKLKNLHGKELVKAGFKQVALGIGIGWGSELAGAALAAMLPAGISALNHKSMLEKPNNLSLFEFIEMDAAESIAAMAAENNLYQANKRDFMNTVLADASKAWKYGGIVGSEASGWVYNVLTKEKNMPPVKWYDWVVGHLGYIPLNVNIGKTVVNMNPVNAITFSGIRHIAQGLYELGKGS